MVNADKHKKKFEKASEEVKLKNKLNTIRTNKTKLHKAVNILTTLTYIEEPKLDSKGNILISEHDSYLGDIIEALGSYIDFLKDYEEAVVNELEEPVPTVEHKLKVYLQNSKKTVRYYYNSTYLFSAPLELYEEITIEFNKLMNEEPKLTLSEVKEKLAGLVNLLVVFRSDSSEEPIVNAVEVPEAES